jgi:hypothetical protein
VPFEKVEAALDGGLNAAGGQITEAARTLRISRDLLQEARQIRSFRLTANLGHGLRHAAWGMPKPTRMTLNGH